MDHKAAFVIGLVIALLWLFPGFRWRAKVGLSALGVLIVAAIAVYPSILTDIGL